jgi:myo-inositol 2-dehydrogenase/D-chiro-inositol 1-dehydrogenase
MIQNTSVQSRYCFPQEPTEDPSKMLKKVRVGIIGCGMISPFQVEAWAHLENAKLVAFADCVKERAQALALKYGGDVYTDYTKMLDSEEIDAVSILLPTFMHSEATIRASEKGKHVICTKPMARTVSECDAMIESCRKADVKLAIDYQHRFLTPVSYARNFIKAGRLGKIFMYRARYGHGGPSFHAEWYWDQERVGGGCINDFGVHHIDLSRWLVGAVKSVYAETGTLVNKGKTVAEDNAVLVLRFENDAIGVIDLSWSQRGGMDRRQEIYGTDGTIFIGSPLVDSSILVFSEGGLAEGIYSEKRELSKGWAAPSIFKFSDPFYESIKNFVACILNDETPIITGEEGKRTQEVVEASYKSVQTGRRVLVK